MAKRPSLAGNVAKADTAKKAASVAASITGKSDAAGVEYGDQMETVSYHLPVEMIEEITELASLRLRRDKLARRAAKASGQKVEGQARRSGSAVVREAVAVHMPEILKEIEALREELGRN